ncbi:epithelial membrane protein 3 [Morphnus guianensis]
MSFLLFAVTALHVLVLVLLFVATLDKAWWVLPDEETVNLWYDCVFQNSTRSWVCASVADSPWLRAVQGLMVGALLLSSVAFALFLWQLHAGPRGRLFAASGGTQLLAGLAVLAGAGLYAAQGGRPPGGRFGHCFVLAWLCVPLALVSGVTYVHLRKRE